MIRIRVFLADDHAVVRDGLKYMLEAQNDLEVVGVASDGRQSVAQAIRLKPDVLVMDIAMPELNGIDAAQQILRANPSIKIIILSMHATREHIFRALQAGALGYVLKESAGQEVVQAVHEVYAGRRFLSPRISEIVLHEFLALKDAHAASPLDRLSAREREVLQLVVEGRSSAEIAESLSLSVKTVDTYRSRLMEKLGISDLPGLVKFAIQHGLTSLE
jgi:DNA-binding NarL/FixJ family response regulator